MYDEHEKSESNGWFCENDPACLWYNIWMKILMHLCCANCALYPVKTLSVRPDVQLSCYWFNPNIEPRGEYDRRLEAVEELESRWGLDVTYNDAYDNALYRDAVEGHEGMRCEACYRVRLERTAQVASLRGADAFTTSLLVSPYQRHELVVEAGQRAGAMHGVEFYYEDFRPGWNEGVSLSRELGLYRQNYCGCEASGREREAEREARREQRREKKRLKVSEYRGHAVTMADMADMGEMGGR